MPTFGFSAFLKLLSLNDRPQARELRSRYLPRTGGGYDFHRRLRQLIHQFVVDGALMEDVLGSVDQITREAEQRSVAAGLERLERWRDDNPGRSFDVPSRTFESPNGEFSVRFVPDFGIEIDGQTVAVHVWNTAHPPLVTRMVYASLALFPELYAGAGRPNDLAVLSLPDYRLYRLSDVPDYSLISSRLVSVLESQMRQIQRDLGLPTPPPAEDRPPA